MELKAGYKQTEIGVIPEDWNVLPLENFTSFISYGFTNPMPFVSSGIALVTAKDVNYGKVQFDSVRFTTEFAYQKLLTDKSRPRKNDLLLTKDGTLGRLAVVDETTICINQSVAILRPNQQISPLFFKLLLESPKYQRCMLDNAGGSTIKHIYITVVNKMLLGVPNCISEQNSIATALSDVDALLAKLDALIAKKRDLKQAAMQQLLTAQTRLPGFSGEWEVKPIGEFTDCTSGGTPTTSRSDFWGGNIRWMNSGELNLRSVYEVEGRITELGLNNSSTKPIPANCVLIGLAGQGKTRGTVAMNFVELCTNQSIAAIFPGASFDSKYLYYNLDLRYEELRSLSTGDGGRGGLNLTIIRSISIPFPKIEEQIAIATVLSDMDAEITTLEARRDKTRTIKQGMMQELLTGRTRLI